MRLNEIQFSDAVPVDSYGPGFFRVAGEICEGPLFLIAGERRDWCGYSDPAPLVGAASELDVLFIGTGAEIAHIPAPFRDALEKGGVAWEIMATDAACRTFNVLLSEGRRIALAAIPV